MKRYLLGLYEKALPKAMSWEEKFQMAQNAGFDYIEISIDETDEKLDRLNWSKKTRFENLAVAHSYGMEFGSMCLSGHRKYPFGSSDAHTRARSLEIMEQALELACDLGVHTIQLAGYDVYYEEGSEYTRQMFLENLEKSVELASKYGVNLGFETMETPFMDTCEKSMKYVHAINSPYLGVYPDLGNLSNAAMLYGHLIQDDIHLAQGHILAAHLKETVEGAYREIPFSTGTTFYSEGISELVAQGVRRYVAEMWYLDGADCEKDLQFAHDFLSEKLDSAFGK